MPGNQPASDTCAACGAEHSHIAGATAPAAPSLFPASAERRQLTVVFCDLERSTALSARLDAEDYYALVQRYHERADELVSRYGGTVAQYLGDGVLAYFGWPAAHGDDADRAVRAGLALVEAISTIVASD